MGGISKSDYKQNRREESAETSALEFIRDQIRTQLIDLIFKINYCIFESF